MVFGIVPMTNGRVGRQGRVVTQKMIVDYIGITLNAMELAKADEFSHPNTRHISPGTKEIKILQKQMFTVPTINGDYVVEIFWCPNCGKLIVNSNSLQSIF